MIKNKKGQIILLGTVILIIIAFIIGLIFFNKIVGVIGKTGFIIGIIIIILAIFHNVVESILMTFLGSIKSLFHV